ncbi:MAG TPA: DUF58 domain-containing protein [Thermoanaerobaculia bacterium]|nr:DUF58 domain-containing protein [Thermoanaerobaculia bacterium]
MIAGSSPARLSPELLAQIKALHFRTRRLVTETFAGRYESAFRGRGMELDEVREYQPGDDVRAIDWNVTARTGAPHVKLHREERELTVLLVVDVSRSGCFGSTGRFKREMAAEVAALLAYTAIASNDRVGLLAVSDRVELYVPPKKGRGHGWRLIRSILTLEPEGRGTDLGLGFDFLARVLSRRSVVFVVSDFFTEGYETGLSLAARRHDLTAVVLTDRREEELPALGLVALEDAESGEVRVVDSSDPDLARHLAAAAERETERRRALLASLSVDQLELATHRPTVDDLARFFHAREARRAR